MAQKLNVTLMFAVLLILLTLAACAAQPQATPASDFSQPLGTPLATDDPATQVAALTEQQYNLDNQAAATAEIMRANAQATVDTANATLNAVQTQNQGKADVVAAQIAATQQSLRANAQATLDSAGATQNAALTQDSIRQTQMADQATSDANAVLNQQNRDNLAAGTQTAVVDLIATQTQAAVVTGQFYADQARRDQEQRQAPLTFVWMLCVPVFVMLLAGLVLWGFWRWLKIQQDNQRLFGKTVEPLPAPPLVIDHQPGPPLRYLDSGDVPGRQELTKPEDQVPQWLDDVKRTLENDAEKDETDGTDN